MMDPEAMSKYIWAILDHYPSTVENTKHDKCPSGEKSWYSYQRDIATKQSLQKPVKWPFTDAILAVINSLFKRLASVELLEGCKNCRTQNPVEALNHVIWSLAPKEQYVSPLEMSLAISLGVCLFNNGMQYTYSNLIEMAGIDTTYIMLQKWAKINTYRVYEGNYGASKDRRKQRKMRKRELVKKQDAIHHLESVQYQSQAFLFFIYFIYPRN